MTAAAPAAAPRKPALVRYEYPFNESIRTMLRLEQLFDRLGQLMPRDAPLDHHFALAAEQGDFFAGDAGVLIVINDHRIAGEDDFFLLGQNLGATTGGFAVTLDQADISGGEHRAEFVEFAEGGGLVAAAEHDHLEVVAGQLHVRAGDPHVVPESDGCFLVRADHFTRAVAFDDGGLQGCALRQTEGRQQSEEGEAGARLHFR